MNWYYMTGAALSGLVACTHSYLGERYIIIRLLRRTDLPKLRGSDEFTRQILRFAWHLTSVAWLGLAAILVYFGLGRDEHSATVPQIIAVTFAVHAVVTFAASRGRHYAWIVFGGIAIVAYVGSWA